MWERVFWPLPLQMRALNTLGFGETSLFLLARSPGVCPSHFKSEAISFLPFPELLLNSKSISIHHLVIFLSFFSHAERRALGTIFPWSPPDCCQAYETCQVTKTTVDSVNCCLPWKIQLGSHYFILHPQFIPSTNFPKTKLNFLGIFSPGFWKALSNYDSRQEFKQLYFSFNHMYEKVKFSDMLNTAERSQ